MNSYDVASDSLRQFAIGLFLQTQKPLELRWQSGAPEHHFKRRSDCGPFRQNSFQATCSVNGETLRVAPLIMELTHFRMPTPGSLGVQWLSYIGGQFMLKVYN
ncbi:hypothetical protein XENTR_v10010704 [Xenopus tropicalis]|nr:hypothetical protein XENTR_v10010704 [Xenopus tropicalis]